MDNQLEKRNDIDTLLDDEVILSDVEKQDVQLSRLSDNISALTGFGETALEHWRQNEEARQELEKIEMKAEDTIHTKNVILLAFIALLFTSIVVTTIIFGDTAKLEVVLKMLSLLTAGAGIGGGAVALLTNSKRKPSPQ